MPPPRVLLAAFVFCAYVATSRALGDFHPFSTHAMYAEPARGRPSRIVVRAGGVISDVDAFDHFACEALPSFADATCPPESPSGTIPYIDREAEAWVRAHTGTSDGAIDVAIVRHVWVFPPGDGAPRTYDCPIAACRAVRR